MRRSLMLASVLLAVVLSMLGSGAASAEVRTWKSVSAGGDATCAIDTADHLWCWGYNGYGQLGNGDPDGTNQSSPLQIGTKTWRSVALSFETTCAIDTEQRAYCWGHNQYGQVGNGTSGDDPVLTPSAVQSTATWRSVVPGPDDTCGITTDGRLSCWGTRANGGVGDGRTDSSLRTVPLHVGSETWRSVFVGYHLACGLTTGQQIKCWGYNHEGSLGTGDSITRNAPTIAGSSANRWSKVSVVGLTTCGITTRGVTKCWGADDAGQVGDGTSGDSVYSPRTLRHGSLSFVKVKTGAQDSCGLTEAGLVRCWGENDANHQFGDGTETSSLDPTDAAGGRTGWTAVSVGDYHSCGLRPDGRILCWGDNRDGELGVGNTTPYVDPVVVGSDLSEG